MGESVKLGDGRYFDAGSIWDNSQQTTLEEFNRYNPITISDAIGTMTNSRDGTNYFTITKNQSIYLHPWKKAKETSFRHYLLETPHREWEATTLQEIFFSTSVTTSKLFYFNSGDEYLAPAEDPLAYIPGWMKYNSKWYSLMVELYENYTSPKGIGISFQNLTGTSFTIPADTTVTFQLAKTFLDVRYAN